MKESKIISYCKEGDPKAFEILVHTYSPMLSAVCRRYLGDNGNTKDTLQECLINIFKGINGYREQGSFEGWLKRIAVTSSLKELRKKKAQTLSLSSLTTNKLDLVSEEPIILEHLKVKDVVKVINQLPEDYRVAFNLFVVDGYSHKEIAKIENIDVTVSRVRVSRARRRVQELLLKNQSYYGVTSARKVD